ncbi:hypothetical protein L2E82_13922 [Cichorium intybus]|uniref:Uncharacterized protein n=1 Tax=Cichorium intybus TaxID=13427 RepID=A0ACB9EYJ7_CICIN|nr:hypothetical protein L2E82_13922 [Cichorium intybus]
MFCRHKSLLVMYQGKPAPMGRKSEEQVWDPSECTIHVWFREFLVSMPVLSEKQVDQVDNVLAGEEDAHGGVIVEMSTQPMDLIMFTCLLKASMLHWKQ